LTVFFFFDDRATYAGSRIPVACSCLTLDRIATKRQPIDALIDALVWMRAALELVASAGSQAPSALLRVGFSRAGCPKIPYLRNTATLAAWLSGRPFLWRKRLTGCVQADHSFTRY
jgi:hypothetical protein